MVYKALYLNSNITINSPFINNGYWQKIQKYLLQTTEQLLSSGCDTPDLILNTASWIVHLFDLTIIKQLVRIIFVSSVYVAKGTGALFWNLAETIYSVLPFLSFSQKFSCEIKHRTPLIFSM